MEEETILIIAIVLTIVIAVAIVGVILLLGFGIPFFSIGLHRSTVVEEPPNIRVRLVKVYYDEGEIIVGIDNNSDKKYTVDIEVSGCSLGLRKTITIDAFDTQTIYLKTSPYTIKSGCTLKVKAWFGGRVVAYKTFNLGKQEITLIMTERSRTQTIVKTITG